MPKRSSGCFTCRARKVRCDEAKPECNTCLRRGTKCPGYRPTQAFILHTFNDQTDKPGIVKEDETRYRYAYQDQEGISGAQQSVIQLRSSASKAVDVLVPRQLSPIAVERIQHLSNFLSLYLPKWEGETLTPPSALILSLPSTPASRQVLLASLDALSAAQLAVSNKNYPLINRSRSLYSTALGQLMRSITQPKTPQEDETLLATYLLALYEVFVGVSSGTGFFYHVQGLLRLLKQRGPASINTKLTLDIFHGIRYYSLTIGFHVRKASILDSPEWLEVTSKAAKPDPWVYLMDLCICVPRLLERTDKLTRAAASAEEFEKVITDSQRLADRAFKWFAKFEKDGPRYTKVDVNSMTGFLQICDDLTYDPVFAFNSWATSNTYLLYWMSMLILRSNNFLLVRKFHQLEPKQLYVWDRELSGYADCICRGVPFSCRPTAGYTGRFSTLTPLVVVRKYFEAKAAKKEAAWCERAYYGTKVPGLYSPPIPIEPLQGLIELVQSSQRYI
ncbi:uncharacterized protein BDR25DRAFT_274717 [Lindgomyces ingoldianus]|uniref:Uncharacterized protein n=1 Tax=Lindgomyces ingoldianus TaxID=673940 RepID=A0ACB6RFM7_9PLEO|nr:uncharacterized protein BDR25DRAFT_274717 [Lindgomyces ingoldianus]KAF2477520.1 hypothetical protein BDR25DRAFT_274717 [Lindgomyces ingoldianus]